jgi:hypothetical protein
MTVLIPQNDNPHGESFASMLSNEISGVHFVNDKVWLIVSPAGDITSWLIPLLCPVCGGAWHFNAGNIEETLATLREKLAGFTLAGIHYQTQVTEPNIRAMQTHLYSDSDIFTPLVEDIPEHTGVSVFPAVALILEKQVPLEMDLSGTEEEIRARFDLDPEEDFEEAISDLRELQEDGYDVEDDLMLLIHPFAMLEATEVFTEDLEQ